MTAFVGEAGRSDQETEKLLAAVARKSGCPTDLAPAILQWLERAMAASRFNEYHETAKVVRHLRLALSVPARDLAFSLEAHALPALPEGKNATKVRDYLLALAREDFLSSVLRSHPEM